MMSKRKGKGVLFQGSVRLMTKLPDKVTGDTETLREKYRQRYGNRNFEREITELKRRTAQNYLMLALALVTIIVLVCGQRICGREPLTAIERPAYGQPAKYVEARADLRSKELKLSQKVQIQVKAKRLSDKEKRDQLKECEEALAEQLRGENESLQRVTKRLLLPAKDKTGAIRIRWESDRSDIIGTDGFVNILKCTKPETVELTAFLTLEDCSGERRFEVKTGTMDEADVKVVAAAAKRHLSESIESLSESISGDRMIFPGTLGEGIGVTWRRASGGEIIMACIAFAGLCVLVYRGRYRQIDIEIKRSREEILADFPDFINRLVLLLNAGLVVSSALSKIAEDYGKAYSTAEQKGRRRSLYDGLYEIDQKVKATNLSVVSELRLFAGRCGVKELMRFAAIVGDNIDKGSTLAEKLETEGSLLWMNRKKRAEERGRLAETKLTFPLVLMLLALVLVTIAPALIGV